MLRRINELRRPDSHLNGRSSLWTSTGASCKPSYQFIWIETNEPICDGAREGVFGAPFHSDGGGCRCGPVLPSFRGIHFGDDMKNQFLTRRSALALAVCTCLGGVSSVYAQSTTGAINGTVPVAGNETVVIENTNGFRREVQVDARGKYAANQLPLGTYSVSLQRDGATVDSRKDVSLRVGASTDVS